MFFHLQVNEKVRQAAAGCVCCGYIRKTFLSVKAVKRGTPLRNGISRVCTFYSGSFQSTDFPTLFSTAALVVWPLHLLSTARLGSVKQLSILPAAGAVDVLASMSHDTLMHTGWGSLVNKC